MAACRRQNLSSTQVRAGHPADEAPPDPRLARGSCISFTEHAGIAGPLRQKPSPAIMRKHNDFDADQQDRMRAALLVAERVDLGGAPAARAADRLVAGIAFTPFFAPAAERCAFTAELSISVTRGGSAQATRAAKMRRQSPRWLQQFQRLKTVVYGPYSGGKARHRQPSRNRDNAAEHPPIVHAPWPRMHHRKVRLDRLSWPSFPWTSICRRTPEDGCFRDAETRDPGAG